MIIAMAILCNCFILTIPVEIHAKRFKRVNKFRTDTFVTLLRLDGNSRDTRLTIWKNKPREVSDREYDIALFFITFDEDIFDF